MNNHKIISTTEKIEKVIFNLVIVLKYEFDYKSLLPGVDYLETLFNAFTVYLTENRDSNQFQDLRQKSRFTGDVNLLRNKSNYELPSYDLKNLFGRLRALIKKHQEIVAAINSESDATVYKEVLILEKEKKNLSIALNKICEIDKKEVEGIQKRQEELDEVSPLDEVQKSKDILKKVQKQRVLDKKEAIMAFSAIMESLYKDFLKNKTAELKEETDPVKLTRCRGEIKKRLNFEQGMYIDIVKHMFYFLKNQFNHLETPPPAPPKSSSGSAKSGQEPSDAKPRYPTRYQARATKRPHPKGDSSTAHNSKRTRLSPK